MTIGVLDLSIVTDRVIQELKAAKEDKRLWLEEGPDGTPEGEGFVPGIDTDTGFAFDFTGLPPQAARDLDGCQVSFYLFHVEPDATYRNTFPTGGGARTIPEQPFALTLHYLLSAHCKNSYIEEQQAMSIALKCLHDHPIMRASVPSGDRRTHEFTLTMEPQSVDDIGRLWLSFATPLGLSAVYRASVIFLTPEPPPEREAPPIVLQPNVIATAECSPALKSEPSITDTVSVLGEGFDERTISLAINNLTFLVVPKSPPPDPDPPLAPGEARVESSTELRVRLPAGTRHGRYRLRVRRTAGGAVEEVELVLVGKL